MNNKSKVRKWESSYPGNWKRQIGNVYLEVLDVSSGYLSRFAANVWNEKDAKVYLNCKNEKAAKSMAMKIYREWFK